MARYSETAKGMKLAAGDSVTFFGVRATVLDVMLLRGAGTGVLLLVQFPRAEMPNVMNLRDVDAVRYDGGWVDLKGEPVTV